MQNIFQIKNYNIIFRYFYSTITKKKKRTSQVKFKKQQKNAKIWELISPLLKRFVSIKKIAAYTIHYVYTFIKIRIFDLDKFPRRTAYENFSTAHNIGSRDEKVGKNWCRFDFGIMELFPCNYFLLSHCCARFTATSVHIRDSTIP